jgi:hypothetical protein
MRRRTFVASGLAGICLAPAARADAAPVVLELFTSQGCSSCPPADALLGRLSQRPGVIALAWHVDYWNYLGWRDRFATRQATERQRSYARQLGSEVFTPALAVDGGDMVVGSNQRAVEGAIRAASPLPVPVKISVTADGIAADTERASRRLRPVVVSYDPEQATDVGAGENSGATLREYRIARSVETLPEWDGGARRLLLKPPERGQGLVVLLAGEDLRIAGAADVPPKLFSERS